MAEKLLEEIQSRLRAKTIYELRQVARAVGVPRPADGRKERILEYMIGIASGESDPVPPAVRGAPPKSSEYDRQLVADILRCREICLTNKQEADLEAPATMSVAGDDEYNPFDFTAEGLLVKTENKWFIKTIGAGEYKSDVFMSEVLVIRYGLREADFVSCRCRRSSLDELAGVASVNSVNGLSLTALGSRSDFEKLTPTYPNRRIKLECGPDGITERMIDLLAPVGAGQRAFVTAPHGSGKTSVLKSIAGGIVKNNPQIKLVIAAIDARPEEASDFRISFPCADVFTSSFDAGAAGHVHTAKMALEYAKRQTEQGADVVLLLDDLTRLARAYNISVKQTSSVLDVSALDSVKKYLAAAKNAVEGGSLTLICSLVADETQSFEGNVYSALKDLCNMRVTLSLKLARSRVYPPIDVEETFAANDRSLLSPAEAEAAAILRRKSIEEIIKDFAGTDGNGSLCEKLLG